MPKLATLSLVAFAFAVTTAATPQAPVRPLVVAPLRIIEGGTVSTLPKHVTARGGKVVVLRGKAPRTPSAAGATAASRPRASPRTAATSTARVPEPPRQTSRDCACAAVGGGGSPSDRVELRSAEQGLRVMIIGPDGLARTRYVPAPPGVTGRQNQEQ